MFSQLCAGYRQAIQESGLTIYDRLDPLDDAWIPSAVLEQLLGQRLRGLEVGHLPNRTKSKAMKVAACRAMGYPVPKSFEKTMPKLPGQHLEVMTLKAMNVQLYNEEISFDDFVRYALVEQCEDGTVGRVRVIDRDTLLSFDTTGTLTLKYQARLAKGSATDNFFSEHRDTLEMAENVRDSVELTSWETPVDAPASGMLMSLGTLKEKLAPLVGMSFPDPGADQERRRGEALHKLICQRLGYQVYADRGTFPDIPHQLLEVKLQTSGTIDLGTCAPDSDAELSMAPIAEHQPRHLDVRYAVVFADTDGGEVTISKVCITTGREFFSVFNRTGGLGVNSKRQIALSKDFFDASQLREAREGLDAGQPSVHRKARNQGELF